MMSTVLMDTMNSLGLSHHSTSIKNFTPIDFHCKKQNSKSSLSYANVSLAPYSSSLRRKFKRKKRSVLVSFSESDESGE